MMCYYNFIKTIWERSCFIMRWSEERIRHEKEVLVNQLETGCGRFAVFVLRTYAYIARECEKNNRNWCYASKVRGKSLISYVYNGPVDHMGYEVVEDAKDKLKKMGYIRYRKVDDQWLLYIEKKIDFCDINHYVRDENECEDFIEKVYQHLLHNGIKIYKYQKICWKCHKKMDVYLKSRQNTPTSVVDEQVGMNAAIFLFILVFFLFFTNLPLIFYSVRGIMMSTKGGFPT